MSNESQASPYRLPRTVLPSSYQVRLRPDLDSERFSGSVTAQISVSEAVDVIVLNAKGLEIRDARVARAGKDVADVNSVECNAELERASLKLADLLPPGDYEM